MVPRILLTQSILRADGQIEAVKLVFCKVTAPCSRLVKNLAARDRPRPSPLFFDVHDGKDLPDSEGIELPGRNEAHRQAITTAGEMLREMNREFLVGDVWKCTSPTKPARRRVGSVLG